MDLVVAITFFENEKKTKFRLIHGTEFIGLSVSLKGIAGTVPPEQLNIVCIRLKKTFLKLIVCDT